MVLKMFKPLNLNIIAALGGVVKLLEISVFGPVCMDSDICLSLENMRVTASEYPQHIFLKCLLAFD